MLDTDQEKEALSILSAKSRNHSVEEKRRRKKKKEKRKKKKEHQPDLAVVEARLE